MCIIIITMGDQFKEGVATTCGLTLLVGAEHGITSDGFFELEDLPK